MEVTIKVLWLNRFELKRYQTVHNRQYEKRLHDGGIGDIYTYDDVYRLVKVKYDVPDPVNDIGTPGSVLEFNYDGLGNRNAVVTDGTPTNYTHNNINEYDDVGGATQVHDNNGNLTDDGTYLYTWDYENRLIEVRLKADNSLVAHYYYDALSRRIEKQTATQTTRYYYDGAHVIEERDGADTVLAHYTYGRSIDEILTMERDGQTYYYHTNALGSVSALTDGTGAVVERCTYTAYGQMSITDGQGNPLSTTAIGNPYGFTGRRYDEETGLWYYRNRYYNPVTGRFISRDPLGYYDSLSLYEYVSSNPVNILDPYGLFGWADIVDVGGTIADFVVPRPDENLRAMSRAADIGLDPREDWLVRAGAWCDYLGNGILCVTDLVPGKSGIKRVLLNPRKAPGPGKLRKALGRLDFSHNPKPRKAINPKFGREQRLHRKALDKAKRERDAHRRAVDGPRTKRKKNYKAIDSGDEDLDKVIEKEISIKAEHPDKSVQPVHKTGQAIDQTAQEAGEAALPAINPDNVQ